MWKPGTDKPHVQDVSANKKLLSSRDAHSPKVDTTTADNNGKTPISSSKKKRLLSGQTMNMRFMKRKIEGNQNDTQRRTSGGGGEPNLNGSSIKSPVLAKDQGEQDVDMDVDEHDSHENDNQEVGAPYGRATSKDMYGVEGSIIGRRSFGGFNAAVERAWKDSKAAASGQLFWDVSGERQKISDEELMERYRPSSEQQPVGNLDDKVNFRKKKKKGLPKTNESAWFDAKVGF